MLGARSWRRWRRHLVGATPEMRLLLPVLLGGLPLVQALQRAVVALVEAPVPLHRQPRLAELVESEIGRVDGANEDRGVADVEEETGLAQGDPGGDRLGSP